MGTPLVQEPEGAVPFIGLGVNQRPLLLCLSVPNLITGGGSASHILDYGYSALQRWILRRGVSF